MNVTVSLTIELEASASLNDMESHIQEARREVRKWLSSKHCGKVKSPTRHAQRVEISTPGHKERNGESCSRVSAG